MRRGSRSIIMVSLIFATASSALAAEGAQVSVACFDQDNRGLRSFYGTADLNRQIRIAETDDPAVTLPNGQIVVLSTDLLATLSVARAENGLRVQGAVSCAGPQGAGFQDVPVDLEVAANGMGEVSGNGWYAVITARLKAPAP